MTPYEDTLFEALEKMIECSNVDPWDYMRFRDFVFAEASDEERTCWRSCRHHEGITDMGSTQEILEWARQKAFFNSKVSPEEFHRLNDWIRENIKEAEHKPDHYAGDGKIRCEDACQSMMCHSKESSMVSHWWGLAHKYVWRWHLKNRVSDIDKAIDCLQRMKEQLSDEGEE